MGYSISHLLLGRWRALSLSLCALVLPLSGCIVNNSAGRGTIIVQWAPQPGYSCASLGISSVNVVTSRDGALYGTYTNGVCESGAMNIQVGEGSYALHVEAIGYDGTVVAASTTVTIPVLAYTTVSSSPLILQPANTVVSGNSSIQATWTVNGGPAATNCAANGVNTVTLSIVDSTQTKIVATVNANCSSGYATAANLAPGSYYVQLDGYTSADVASSPSWGTPGLKGPFQLASNTDLTFNTPLDIVKLTSTSTKGNLSLSWTLFGTSPATGCAKYAIDKFNVTVLGADKTQEIASVQLACTAGGATFSNLPVGSVYVRIDEANPPDASAFGNVNLTGPITLSAGQTMNVSAPIDVGSRSIISIPVGFADSGSCSAHGVSSVQFQISGNDKLIVPFNDADATKPCDLTGATYKLRVIDLLNSPPSCAVPSTATGLVICNAAGNTKVTVQAHGLVGNTIGYAAKMDVTGLSDGKLTAVQTPIKLQTCGVGDPLCQ